MIKLDILSLLKAKGKSKYWLYKQLGMSYQNFNRMVNNETKSIRYENIEAMCFLLNCTPNDLFIRSGRISFAKRQRDMVADVW